MRILITIFIFIVNINSAMITGSQDKLSISGGSMNVTSEGVSKIVNSGEITFIQDGKAPSDARKLKSDDLKDITDDLKMSNAARPVNLKFAPTKKIIAQKIGRLLTKAGISRANMEYRRENKDNTNVALYIKQIDINLIKNIYPVYYKAVSKYYQKHEKRLSKKSKTPTIVIKLNMMKKYHRSIFKKYH